MAAPVETVLSVRAVSIDYEMRKPIPGVDVCHSSFSAAPVHLVPIVRFYGATPAGQKVCLHLHKAFPYFFVPYGDDLPRDRPSVNAYIHKLAVSIDKAMDLSIHHGISKGSARNYVFNIIVVRGKPFYGFHATEKLFLKIFLFNPMDIARVVALLRSGGVMGRPFVPHEAHIPFLLQVFIDYNIAGMNFVHLSRVSFRWPLPSKKVLRWNSVEDLEIVPDNAADPISLPSDKRIWLAAAKGLDFTKAPRETRCDLEIDSCTENILNVFSIVSTPLSHNSQQKLVASLALLWEDERARQKEMSTPPRPADDPLAPQAMASQQPREVSTPSTLFTTDELLARVRRMIEDERAKNPQAPEQQDLGIMHGTPLSNSNMVELPADQLPASPPASPLPNVDAEVVLSQSDLDTVDILKELLMDTGAPEEEDEAEAEHAPREVREAKRAEASQREAFDILEASQADFIEQHAENPPQQLQPRAHVDVAYEVEEEEEHLFSIPQMDGSADEMAKKSTSPGKRKYCSLFPRPTAAASASAPVSEAKAKQKTPEKATKEKTSNPKEPEGKKKAESKSPPQMTKNAALDTPSKRVHTFKRATVHELPLESPPKRPRSPTRALPPPPAPLAPLPAPAPAALDSAARDEEELPVPALSAKKRILVSKIQSPQILVPETPAPPAPPSAPPPPVPMMPPAPSWLLEQAAMQAPLVVDEELLPAPAEVMAWQRTDFEPNDRVTFSDASAEPDLAYCVPVDHCLQPPQATPAFPSDPTVAAGPRTPTKTPTTPAAANGSPSAALPALKTPTLPISALKRLQIAPSPMVPQRTTPGPEDSPRKEDQNFLGSALRKPLDQTPRLPLAPKRVRFAEVHIPAPVVVTITSVPGASVPSSSPPPNLPRVSPPRPSTSTSGLRAQEATLAPSAAPPVAVSSSPAFPAPVRRKKLSAPIPFSPVEPSLPPPREEVLPPKSSAPQLIDAASSTQPLLTGRKVLRFKAPPSRSDIMLSTSAFGGAYHLPAHISNPKDLPPRPKLVAGVPVSLNLQLQPFQPPYLFDENDQPKFAPHVTGLRRLKRAPSSTPVPLMPARLPPSRASVEAWLRAEEREKERRAMQNAHEQLQRRNTSQTSPAKESQIEKVAAAHARTPAAARAVVRRPQGPHSNQHLTVMSVEVHVNTRGDLVPNPALDAIGAIVYVIRDDDAQERDLSCYSDLKGVMVFLPLPQDPAAASEAEKKKKAHVSTATQRPHFLCDRWEIFHDELAMLRAFTKIVAERYDVDIFVGWEVQSASIGFLLARAQALKFDMQTALGRCSLSALPAGVIKQRETDPYGLTHSSGVSIGGRVVLNLWRIMRSETKLTIYTLENVVFETLAKRIPHYTYRTLTQWFLQDLSRALCLGHIIEQTQASLLLMEKLDIVPRTSELARVFGIDFFSVLSRGSQYRVESMMMRLTKPHNYILFSPSTQQVAQQKAPECIPLIMEPMSRMYSAPVLVLDFQSLYPSIVIAYNYCYSTCLGKIGPGGVPRKFGTTTLKLPPGLLEMLGEDGVVVSPNEVMFVKKELREGVLPRMLREILETRVMVKQAMKLAKKSNDSALNRMLHARQLGLKMIANVTYGYTSASFSGRMPCVDIADSIVQTGRQTLENAINLISSTAKWKARVVYGDTDSVFVELPHSSKEEAFRIGNEIASAVTAQNPRPVKLQFEKVYYPCILVSKKRYVGYKYESAQQATPTFEAKGVETVRRDSCPAVASIMEKSLQILFESKDLSRVKHYLTRQFTKIMNQRVSVKEFIFAKEVRLGTYSERVPPPPAAIVAMKRLSNDPRAEPKYGERIPYVVVSGPPNSRLVDLVVSPHQLISQNGSLRLNATYYITKQLIPSLDRLLGLAGADVMSWYNAMPRIRSTSVHSKISAALFANTANSKGANLNTANSALIPRRTLDQYYLSARCPLCDALMKPDAGLCEECTASPQDSCFRLTTKAKQIEAEYYHLLEICMHCTGMRSPVRVEQCDSLDCPIYFERNKLRHSAQNYQQMLNSIKW